MIIGTIQLAEAFAYDSHEGFHQFHAPETQEPFGGFEIFWVPLSAATVYDYDEDTDLGEPGWYWWSCLPGCLPDSERVGPFGSSRAAHKDADEWSPDYDPPPPEPNTY